MKRSSRPTYEDLAALVVEQAEKINQLEAEVADLKRRLAQNSRNSSRPPSSDGLAKPPVKKSLRRPSGRKPGGQKGHKGSHLKPVAVPDQIVKHAASACSDCGGSLLDAPLQESERRQVFDLPEVRLKVTEHVREHRLCRCGKVCAGKFPEAVIAPTQYGPRFKALSIYLLARQHLPYKRTSELLADWMGAPVSTGTLARLMTRAGADLGPFEDEVHSRVLDSPVAHFDETGARVQGRLRWLFCASTDRLTSFSMNDKRGKEGLDHHLADFKGTAVHDGWKPYRGYEKATHALCNAHHLREIQAVIESDDDGAQSWAKAMDEFLRGLKRTVENAASNGAEGLDPLTLAHAQAAYARIVGIGHRESPENTVRTGKRGFIAQTPARNLLCRLDEYREDVLRFAHDFSVPFDNNLVERDIRMVKLQQKVSGCWRTTEGANTFLALRSYLSTARKQGHDLLDVLGRLVAGNPWMPVAAEP